MENMCDSCMFTFDTCPAENIVFSIDVDRSLRGAEADKVIKCDGYIHQE